MFYDIKRREVIIHRHDVREKQNQDFFPQILGPCLLVG